MALFVTLIGGVARTECCLLARIDGLPICDYVRVLDYPNILNETGFCTLRMKYQAYWVGGPLADPGTADIGCSQSTKNPCSAAR